MKSSLLFLNMKLNDAIHMKIPSIHIYRRNIVIESLCQQTQNWIFHSEISDFRTCMECQETFSPLQAIGIRLNETFR